MDCEYIDLKYDEIKTCLNYAKNACIGGKSNIHTNTDKRKSKLLTDNFIGQVGTLAGCIFLYGRELGLSKYKDARDLADKNPHVGDGGRDIVGENIDIKCSYMRRSKDPYSYNLLIRPREKHTNWTYVQTLADYRRDINLIRVYIVGWIKTEDLPDKVETKPPFDGAYKMPVTNMRSFPIDNFPRVA